MSQPAAPSRPPYATVPPALGTAASSLPKVWLRWLGIALIATIAVLTGEYCTLPWWGYWLSALLIAAIYWHGNALIFLYLRRKLPNYEHTACRVLLHTLLALVFVAVVALAVAWRNVQPGLGYWPSYWYTFSHSLLTAAFVTSVYEGTYFFQQWRRICSRVNGFERTSAVASFEALKQQLDPHFLFNSLNTLAALIGDNELAQNFLDNLADVYRYVLLSKIDTTVPLSQEMSFVDAYLYVNRVRFGSSLEVAQELGPEALRLHVPSLVVQQLVENALRHNAISRQAPLRLTIRAAEGMLSVTNTIHPKMMLEKSARQGLQNIVKRFQFITDRPVSIENRGDEFEVTLPLLPDT